MTPEPRVEHRDEQPYAAIRTSVTVQGLAGAVDRYFPEVFGWLPAQGVEPAGAPSIRDLRIDMDRELEIQLAAPVTSEVRAADQVRSAVLPAGRYVTLLHVGP